ncbi:MAG: 2-amino-4-hydroxy-6-hydroxymethyldihydropteridine diphosphokinase [Clostridia bacterium]|nr:2-amino-4-hydroxy-6-hydroxymethyldihydropteridine diphosphokinase [Clostridia bacterium]
MKRAVVALGSNLGDSRRILTQAVTALDALPGTGILAVSGLYRTAPWGYADQPDFLNAAVLLATPLSPRALLGACLGIEAAAGRRRTFANAPRPLDLDLLLYEGVVMQEPELTLPHPRMQERAFVLVPLADLFPDGEALGYRFTEYLRRADRSGVEALGPWFLPQE